MQAADIFVATSELMMTCLIAVNVKRTAEYNLRTGQFRHPDSNPKKVKSNSFFDEKQV